MKCLGFYTKLKNLDVGNASKILQEIRLHFLSIFGWILRCGVRGGVRGTETQMLCTGLLKMAINQYLFRTYFCVCASVPELERHCAKSFILKLVYPCISFSRRVRVRAVFHLPIAAAHCKSRIIVPSCMESEVANKHKHVHMFRILMMSIIRSMIRNILRHRGPAWTHRRSRWVHLLSCIVLSSVGSRCCGI